MLNAIVIDRPQPTEQAPQHLCLDKAFDSPRCRQIAEEAGYTPHIRHIGEEKLDTSGEKTHPVRRWVVERTLAWLSRCRGILVRYEKKANNYMAVLKLACALLWYRRLHRLEDAESAF
jgi:putative transposase